MKPGELIGHWGGPGEGFDWPDTITESRSITKGTSGLAAMAVAVLLVVPTGRGQPGAARGGGAAGGEEGLPAAPGPRRSGGSLSRQYDSEVHASG